MKPLKIIVNKPVRRVRWIARYIDGQWKLETYAVNDDPYPHESLTDRDSKNG